MLHLFQTMLLEEMLVEKEFAEARDKARYNIADATGQRYQSIDKLYGGTNDEAGGYSNYGSNNDKPRDSTPYMPLGPETEQNENGYVGLLPPIE